MTEHSIAVEVITDPPFGRPELSRLLAQAATFAADSRGFSCGEIAIRVTGDDEIRVINRQHLGHDYATDVISFSYAADSPHVEGEIVISLETAERTAASLADWSTEKEMVLYVVHGVLHVCGMDDGDQESRAEMRRAEQEVLVRMGIPEISRCGADTAPTCEITSRADNCLEESAQ